MAKSEDLVKYITQQVVTYIDTPAEVRKQHRQERRSIRNSTPWTVRWFGLLPMSIMVWKEQKRKKQPTPE